MASYFSVNLVQNNEAVCDGGLVGYLGSYTISGLGLVSFGFLWGANDIWTPADSIAYVTWVGCTMNSGCGC